MSRSEASTWQEFRDAGMLWLVNVFLRPFGWFIGVNRDDDGFESVFPCRGTRDAFDRAETERQLKRVVEQIERD